MKNSSKTAFTLIELIVSLSLVSVIVLGIFSINTVLKNNNQDYGQRYLVKSETQATLNHILNNASLAVGSAMKDSSNNPDLGILIGTSSTTGLGNSDPVNNPNSFCIHQDIPSIINPDDTTPNYPNPGGPPDYSNSRWLCYTWYDTGTPVTAHSGPYQIYYCAMSFTASASNRGAASCAGIGNSQFLGTAYSITNPAPPAFTNVTFSITIQNRLNNSLPIDPANNPEVQVSGSVSPSHESA